MTPESSPSTRPAPHHWAVWLFSALPFLPLLLVIVSYRGPLSQPGVMRLAGEWSAAPADSVAPFSPSTEGWKEIHLPGAFSVQGVASSHLWLRRSFVAQPELVDQDSTFIVGNVRGAALKVYVNGELVGARGEPNREFMGYSDGSEAIFVPGRLVHAGRNDLALELFNFPSGRDGITDARLLFGRRDVLTPWHFNDQQIRTTFEQGSLVLIFFLSLLIIVLWTSQRGRQQGRLYASTLSLFGAAALYLMGKSGFLAAMLPATWQLRMVGTGAILLGVSVPHFLQRYFFASTNRLTHLNTAVGLAAVSAVAFFPPYTVLRIYNPWLLGVVATSIGMATLALIRRSGRYAPLAASACYLIAAAALSDLLGDLDLIYAPRLFTFTVANMAIMAGAVVVAEFLQLARENATLSGSLQVRNEELAEALLRAQEASRVKSEFLANTSHELRTPLNAIINIPQGLVEQLEQPARLRCEACGATFELDAGEEPRGGPCPDCQAPLQVDDRGRAVLAAAETSRLLKSVVRSGNHLLSVVNDILDYSKLEAGRVVLHRDVVAPRELVDAVMQSMEPVAVKAGVKLLVEGGCGPEVRLEADRVKLHQVLLNLVANAIKFSDGRGQVTITTQATDGEVRFAVKDQGIGISPEHQSLIFEGFRQVEGGNTRRFGGTGLGLAISSRIVTMHGGTLRVDSALGAGSTFIVTLPRAVERPASTPGERLIAVVDDERAAVDAAQSALASLGLRVVGVPESRGAVTRLRELKPQLVLLDVMLPELSGVDVLRDLRADPELRDVPVLVTSALADNDAVARELGAPFIAKPWNAADLAKLITSLLEKPHASR
ncbi:MAG: ATP-binding protein [Myxococcota bacterium]